MARSACSPANVRFIHMSCPALLACRPAPVDMAVSRCRRRAWWLGCAAALLLTPSSLSAPSVAGVGARQAAFTVHASPAGGRLGNSVPRGGGELGMPWRGVDLSQLGTEDCNGLCPPFRSAVGRLPEDALGLLRNHGANTFRMRMWNMPCADGRCNASQYSYANLAGVLLMAARGCYCWLPEAAPGLLPGPCNRQ